MTETPSSVDDNLILLEGLEAFSKHALEIISQAQRNLYILSEILEPSLYHNIQIEAAISELARTDRNAEIKILVKQIRPLVEQNHLLLKLARRLPSKVKLRKLLVEPENNDRSYMIGDNHLLLYRHDENQYAGFINYKAAPEVAKILEDFNYLWQRQSAEDVELRNLSL